MTRAEEITKVLNALQIDRFSEVGKEIRKTIALELLGEQYQHLKKINSASFVQGISKDDIEKAQFMKGFIEDLKDRGLLKGEINEKISFKKK